MRIPLNWLKEYVDFDLPPSKVADILTNLGIEAVVLEKNFPDFRDILVGEILKIEPHPSNPHLKVVILDIGDQKIQSVSAAPNLEVGLKVPVAPAGIFLGEKKIEKLKFDGIVSEGVVLSESELGISDDHSGVMVLDNQFKPGLTLDKVFSKIQKEKAVLEAEITPQRPDCLSMIGIARELAAGLGKKVKYPKISFKESLKKATEMFSVELKAKDLCPKYFARVLKIEKNPPSPSFIQERLSACGLRPINAVVDITNYVMLEMGQPLHAFSGTKIKGRKIIVREAKEGEEIVTLDGERRILEKGMLVIADEEKPIAIAGIMGGQNTEVDMTDQLIVLEAALFNPFSVRRTSRKLGLRTEASLRFEKGLWVELAEQALDRAAQLIGEICGGEILRGKIEAGEGKTEKKKIKCPLVEIEKKIGIKVSENQIKKIFSLLEIPLQIKNGVMEAEVPPFRPDLRIKEDLLEEIARLFGYDKVPSTFPTGSFPPPAINKKMEMRHQIKEILKSLGGDEVYTYSFVSENLLNLFSLDKEKHLKIKNPITSEHEYMRTTLIPSLVGVMAKNQKNFDFISIFEIAFVYLPFSKKPQNVNKENAVEVNEVLKVSGLMTQKGKTEVFYQAKEVLEILFAELNIENPVFVPTNQFSFLHPYRQAMIKTPKYDLGVIGEIHPLLQEKLKSKKRIAVFELDFEALFNSARPKVFKPLPRYPAVILDLSILVDENILTTQILEEIQKISPYIETVIPFDLYKGPQIPPSYKSLSFRIIYRHPQRTLKEEEAKEIHQKIIQVLERKFNAKLR